MIARDEIRELANFHSPETCALTFYYQPSTPQDLSHRGENIMTKDKLLAVGERYEAMISADKAADARYR